MEGNKKKRNGYIGLAALVILAVVTILGSDPLYKAIDNMARPAIYTPGTYTGTARGYGGTVTCVVTVSEKAIEKIEVTGEKETLLDQVIPALTDKIISTQSADVDAVTGATMSSNAIKKAVEQALAEARGEAVTEGTAEASKETEKTGSWQDGSYSYEAPEFDGNGYKDIVKMVIKDGAITELSWDSEDKDGAFKSQLSMDGKYVMTEDGPKWYEQSEAVVNYVLENQSVDGLINGEGYTDTVSSVSINLFGFVNGVKECLKQASGEAVLKLQDGVYRYEAPEFDDKGYKDVVNMTVEGNAITALTWDNMDKDGAGKSQLSMDGKYVMTEDGPTWAEQSQAVADYVLKHQSINGLIDGEGYTDTVASVSINLFGFVTGVEDCLKQAASAKPLTDGSYSYEAADFDQNGFKDMISLTVKDGAVTEVAWDCVDKDGVMKSQLSMDGKYVMTETGLKWHEQAQAVTDYVLSHQSAGGLIDGEGYTDAVSGVSINLYGFVNGVEDCLTQAAK